MSSRNRWPALLLQDIVRRTSIEFIKAQDLLLQVLHVRLVRRVLHVQHATTSTIQPRHHLQIILCPSFTRDLRTLFFEESISFDTLYTDAPTALKPTRFAATFVGVQARTSQVVSLCIGFQRRLHQVLLNCEPSWKFPRSVDFCEQPPQQQLSNPASCDCGRIIALDANPRSIA